MENFIQEFVIGIFLICSIIGTAIYCIVFDYNNTKDEKTQEDDERNKGEVVLLWINLSVCIVTIIVFCIMVIVDNKLKCFDHVKTLTNFNILLLILSLICIVTTSIGWDYFSRQSESCVQRRFFIFLTFIVVLFFLKVLDNFYANLTGHSMGSSIRVPLTFSSAMLQSLCLEQK